MSVAITGLTQADRGLLGEMINGVSNAKYVANPRVPSHYIVANDPLSSKVLRFEGGGSLVITEDELLEYIHAGTFPAHDLARPLSPNRLKVTWAEFYRPPRACQLEYHNVDGDLYTGLVHVVRRGTGNNGHEYIGAYEGATFKTYRTDRILTASYLSDAVPEKP